MATTIGAFDVDQSVDGEFVIDMGDTGITPGNITITKWREGDTAWQAVDAGTAVTHELSNNIYRGTLDENDPTVIGPMMLRGVQGANVGLVALNVKDATVTPSGKPASTPLVPDGL